MRWIEEPNKTFPKWPYQVLTTERDEPLRPALIEYWKRIFTDGYALTPASRASLAIDIGARTFDADDPGFANAVFRNSLNKQAEGIGTYLLRSEHFAGGRILAALFRTDQRIARKIANVIAPKRRYLSQSLSLTSRENGVPDSSVQNQCPLGFSLQSCWRAISDRPWSTS
ncbi:MAG: hypothetical protein LAP39_18120 [Acidobacteriia bacterium]|nr:hypothetical protein [Terriglobia bacterium]